MLIKNYCRKYVITDAGWGKNNKSLLEFTTLPSLVLLCVTSSLAFDSMFIRASM